MELLREIVDCLIKLVLIIFGLVLVVGACVLIYWINVGWYNMDPGFFYIGLFSEIVIALCILEAILKPPSNEI